MTKAQMQTQMNYMQQQLHKKDETIKHLKESVGEVELTVDLVLGEILMKYGTKVYSDKDDAEMKLFPLKNYTPMGWRIEIPIPSTAKQIGKVNVEKSAMVANTMVIGTMNPEWREDDAGGTGEDGHKAD